MYYYKKIKNGLRLIFNIIRYTFTNPRDITILNKDTGELIEHVRV